MTKNLKKRIYTSILLSILLFLMFINNYILGYFLIVFSILSILEYLNMSILIFNKSKIKKLFSNLIFIFYMFYFCSIFLILSSFIYLKIMIFMIILICVASDIGGFIFGKIFKGPKLTKISPNKTISGAIGSLFFSLIATLLLFFYLTKDFDINILIAGSLISIACQIGDLFFSFFKRKAFLKDSGNFLPGHGGILDRIDGLLLGLPVGLLALLTIY
jgi:phosphatidate cytidylyltransferase